MYNICIRMIPDKMLAEEVLQDAFISVFQKLDKFRAESSFGNWLKRIVINKSIDVLRAEKMKFVPLVGKESEDMDEPLEKYEEIKPELIHSLIKELPDGARTCFNLFALENYKHREIAEMLNISESTSKSQFQRARQLLHEELKKRNYVR